MCSFSSFLSFAHCFAQLPLSYANINPKWEVHVNVGLEDGEMGSFPDTYNDPFFFFM